MPPGTISLDPPPGAIDEVIAEYLEAEDQGRPFNRTEAISRHPTWASELTAFFAAHDHFDHLVLPLREIALLTDPATAGHHIGGYEILGEFARGGMGVIYKARQVRLDRVVALKMILTGVQAPAEERRRFQIEAEAAARLDHPNIVPVYDVGEADGRPFYSMKLVPGRNLADHLGERPLPATEAARLIATVARAVGYAHDRGVLHRDLKPANILIEEGTGVPHVTDFGLARRLNDDARLTPPGCALGTPAYLAPELLEPTAGRPAQPTIAGDVYALGTILYECLTGRAPFRADSPLNTLLEVLRSRPLRPRDVVAGIPVDLETICLKCLDQNPARRYSRAADLADDLDRWQRGEPVLARPIGSLARFSRWCRRKPAIASLAGGLVAAVGVGLIVSYREWQRAETNYQAAETNHQTAELHRRIAEEHEAEAEANFWLAHDAVCRFYDDVDQRHLKDVPGLKAARREVLKAAREYFERFLAQRGGNPKLQRELADAQFRIAAIDHAIGANTTALAEFQRAMRVSESLVALAPDDLKARQSLARTLQRMMNAQTALRQWNEALATGIRARAMFEDLARQQPNDSNHLVDLAVTIHNLGNTYQALDRTREAGDCYEAKVELCLILLERWPDHPGGPVLLASGFQNIAHVASALGSPDTYVCWCLAGVTILETHLQYHPEHNPTRTVLARTLRDLASYYCARKQPTEALAVLARALPLLSAAATADPEDADIQIKLASHHRQVGHAKMIAGDVPGALAAYEQARLIAERLTARLPDEPEYQEELAGCYFDLGTAEARQNKWDAAVRTSRRAADIRTRLCAIDPDRAEPRHRLAMALFNLAALHAQRRRWEEAANLYSQAAEADEAAVRLAPEAVEYRRGLAGCYTPQASVERERGHLAAAVALVERRRDLFPDASTDLTAAAREFARIANLETAALPPAEAEACRRAADAAVSALLAASAHGATDYRRVRLEPVFDRLRDRLPVTPSSPRE